MIISVIVPVYNGCRTLPACLQALQCQTRPPDEVIIVDDGSTDGSVALARSFGVTVVRQAKAGPAAARNYGASVARGDILLFTDADCAPAPDWVEQVEAAFADPAVAGIRGTYRTRQGELVARFVQQEYQDRYDRIVGQPRIDFVDTYSAAYRRHIFLASTGFDPSFPTASVEDQEFSFRLAQQQHRLVYAPNVVVYHQHDRTLAGYMRRKYWIGYWKAAVMRRHPVKLVHDSHTPQTLKLQMGLALLGGALGLVGLTTHRRPAKSGSLMAWGLFFLSGVPFYLKILRRDRAVLVVAPLLVLIRAWALNWGFFAGSLRLLYLQLFHAHEKDRL